MSGESIRVLLIEDNPADAQAIKIMLGNADPAFNLKISEKLMAGVEILSKKDIDVVLLDLTLPDCQELKSLEGLRDKFPELPIVVFTGIQDEELPIKALQKGAQDYLIKGEVDKKLLVRTIRYAIERNRLRLELESINSELQESETRFRSLIEKSSDAILFVDSNRVINFANLASESIFDCNPEKLIGEIFDYPVEQGKTRTIEVTRNDGEQIIVEMHVTKTESRGLRFYLVTLKEVSELFKYARKEEKLQEITLTDELTGLHNRRGFYTLAEQLIRISNFTKSGMILFFIDVDKLKYINDTFSHQDGDQALIDTAGILKKTFRESDIIARFGGDEFVIFAKEARKEISKKIITRLRENIKSHNASGKRPYNLSLSIGMAHYDPESPFSIEELLGEADRFMYESKKGKGF
jgi:two-component system cell cycle response regulator